MIEQPRKPLIVRLRNYVGDVVLGVPALRLLQSHGYELALIGKPWAADLLEAQGWQVHTRPKRLADRVAQLRRLRQVARALDAGFDGRANALAMPWAFSAALEMRLAGLHAVGYAHEARSWLLHRSLPMPAPGHALLNYWGLACQFLGVQAQPPAAIELKVSAAQQQGADKLLRAHGVGERYVLICPFASGNFEALTKTWPHFAVFADLLARRGHPVVVCPGPGEEEHALRHYPQAHCLSGVTLGVYNALLQRSALVVANDTGPAHMAAAVGAHVLSMLGPTEPALWAPWGPTVEVLRQHPEWPSAQAVLERAQQCLDKSRA